MTLSLWHFGREWERHYRRITANQTVAAIVPALSMNNAIYGSQDWVGMRFTPGEVGENAFMALANGFKSIIEGHGRQPRDLTRDLEIDPGALQDMVSMALDNKPDWAEVLLFIDQFGELFTLVAFALSELNLTFSNRPG